MIPIVILSYGSFLTLWFWLIFSFPILLKILPRTSDEFFLTPKEILKYLIIFFTPHLFSQIILTYLLVNYLPLYGILLALFVQVTVVIPTFYHLKHLGQLAPVISSLEGNFFAETEEEAFNCYGMERLAHYILYSL